jgi:hypothetical protein
MDHYLWFTLAFHQVGEGLIGQVEKGE